MSTNATEQITDRPPLNTPLTRAQCEALPVGTELAIVNTPTAGPYYVGAMSDGTHGYTCLAPDNPASRFTQGERFWMVKRYPASPRFTVGQRVNSFEEYRALPVGSQMWLNGQVGGRLRGKVGEDEWDSSTSERIINTDSLATAPTYYTIERIGPAVWEPVVGARVPDPEAADSLPVGTVLLWDRIVSDSGEPTVRRTKRPDGEWWCDGESCSSTSLDLPALTVERIGDGAATVFKVGDRVKIADPCYTKDGEGGCGSEFYGNVGTVRAEDDGTWGPSVRIADGSSNVIGPQYLTLIGVAGEAAAELPPAPRSEETVRQFKHRFRSLALSSSTSSDIDKDPVIEALDSLGFTSGQTSHGMVVYARDENLLSDLPEHTVVKDMDTDAVFAVVGGYLTHVSGPSSYDWTSRMEVVYAPGCGRESWVDAHQAYDFDGEQAGRDIQALKVQMWDIGWKAKVEHSWCGVFEQTMGIIGVNRLWAEEHGWSEEVAKEEVTITVDVRGWTVADPEPVEDFVSDRVSLVEVQQARMEWAWSYSIEREVEVNHCGCELVNREAVAMMLADCEIEYTGFEFEVTCANG